MRILSISNIFPPGFIGGYELGAFEVLHGLTRRGHTVEVLTSDYFVDDTGADTGSDTTPAVRRTLDCAEVRRSVQEVNANRPLGDFAQPRNLREIAGRLAVFRPDAVLCFNLAGLGPPALLQLLVASGMRPVLYLMDNVFAGMTVDAARCRAFAQVFGVRDWQETTRFLFMSRNVQHEVERVLGITASHASIVPGWFDTRALAGAPEPRDGDRVRFMFASRIAAHKGTDIVLEACRLLVEQGFTRFVVDIHGLGEVATMLQSVAALGLRDHVRYKGAPPKDELLLRYASYDALLFPTWQREPFGFVVPEAAAAGCIPIMTAGIGAAEWFLDGVDCFKIQRQPQDLAAAMLRVATMPGEGLTAMRQRARATAGYFFRFESALDRLETALREAEGPPSRSPRAAEAALAILTTSWRSRPHG